MSKWFSRKKVCPKCEGDKMILSDYGELITCPRCGGRGWITGPSMM